MLKLNPRIDTRDKQGATWRRSQESSIVGNLKLRLRPDRFLQQSMSNSSHLLLTVVTMVGNRVVAAEIIVALVADERESFTGTTMVNFWLFANLVFQLLFIFQFAANFVHEFALRLLIVQSRPKEYSNFTTFVPAILFYFVSATDVSDFQINPFYLVSYFQMCIYIYIYIYVYI